MDPQLYRRFYEIEDRFWWSVGTRRVFFQLIRELGHQPGRRALDVGCGTGIMLREFPADWTLVAGCDFTDLALSFCRERGLGALVRGSAVELPFATESLDLVMALDVVEHLDDDTAAMREITRVCRRGGHVLVHVPAFPILWTDKDVLNHHRRRYRRAELLALIGRSGLQVERLFYLNVFLFPVALLRAIAERLIGTRRAAAPAPSAPVLDAIYRIPDALNRAMTTLMDVERHLVTRVPVPFGMSLVCLARKP